MQCEEWADANSELFKEAYDETVHKNSYKRKLYELISASLTTSYLFTTWEEPSATWSEAAAPLKSPSCLPLSSGVGQPTIGRPFYVQAKGQLRLTWRPSAGSPQSEGSSVDQLKGRPFYVQAKGQLWPTRAFYAEYAQYTPVVNHLSINTSRREVCFRYQAPA